jgi:N-acetylmuramoyl-L-alanine amidase CwlA
MGLEVNRLFVYGAAKKTLKSIDYITIHAARSQKATAEALAFYQTSGALNYRLADRSKRLESWHYTVDSIGIWQSFEDSAMCRHAGTVSGDERSIGIKICDKRPRFQQACNVAAQLTAALMWLYEIPLTRVVQRGFWSGKTRNGVLNAAWKNFIADCEAYYNAKKVFASRADKDITLLPEATVTF